MKHITIVVPVWNEEKNIPTLVNRIYSAFQKVDFSYDILFVDDHSTDKTTTAITNVQKKFPVSLLIKEGEKGKAFSLCEGIRKAEGDIVAILDADLQYPPEAIPEMASLLNNHVDIVVANRIKQKTSFARQFISTSFKKFFGNFLFGLNHDIQAGLKVFKRDICQHIEYHPSSGWTFDLEFLLRASQAGFGIENYDVEFSERAYGKSKVSYVKTSLEIGLNALALKTRPLQPAILRPVDKTSMRGAGIGFKKKKYITHSTLSHTQSALTTITTPQRIFIFLLLLASLTALSLRPLPTLQVFIGILSTVYFIDTIFNFFLVMKSLHVPQEITSTEEEIRKIDTRQLPIYSILCPLYKEAHVIPQFLESIEKLDYPKNKLDILLLLEEDDADSIAKVERMYLPSYVRSIVVPHSMPKTKPKACNYGLSFAKGEYLVIYDAEDAPDPLQLKKAFLGFQKVGEKVLCLQAKLNYYNPHQNLLTRFFTAEYSLWFDVTLTGLQAAGTSIPLGGTSNHFRTKDLLTLQGWDPFNVTEDADLGIRLFKRGYKTAIIDSVTLEEANSNVFNWIRQRSRWIKGYMQTYLVHTRQNFGLTHRNFWHSLLFHLTIGGKIAFILINPFLWLATISYFVLYRFVGPTIETLYPSYVFYMALISLVFGNFMFVYYYMIG
ncbi:MAG TPA: glycosyltransferase, partial [Candidatus Eisenbacteria bacterium]|nr:glycosyltransferase [Candidatus Eisenbacteria bacterium]